MNQIPLEPLLERHDAAGYIHTRFAKPPGFTHRPGQYIAIQNATMGKARYLAIASHPDEQELFFLSRQSCHGPSTFISLPQGGFCCDYRVPKPFLYITHGSGISALRPAILERSKFAANKDALLYGVADEQHEPELDILQRNFALQQVRAYSRSGKKERVQQVLLSMPVRDFGAVLLVGNREMMSEVRSILKAKHFPPDQIYTNS